MPTFNTAYLDDIVAELKAYGYKTRKDQIQLLLALINYILYGADKGEV